MVYLGIDPGAKGGIATIDDESGEVKVFPYSDEMLIKLIDSTFEPIAACVEKVGAMPNQGVVSMFNFGTSYGKIQGILMALKIGFELIPPQKWKREFSITKDKNLSIAVAKRLFADISLKRTERCTTDSDGMAESLLIAEYARRHMK